jgi:hypothetical protein
MAIRCTRDSEVHLAGQMPSRHPPVPNRSSQRYPRVPRSGRSLNAHHFPAATRHTLPYARLSSLTLRHGEAGKPDVRGVLKLWRGDGWGPHPLSSHPPNRAVQDRPSRKAAGGTRRIFAGGLANTAAGVLLLEFEPVYWRRCHDDRGSMSL